jgi:uncharacterized protein YkwD
MQWIAKSVLAVSTLALVLYHGTQSVRAQNVPSDAEEILILVNQRRAEEGMAPLRRNAALEKAAQSWAATMAKTGYFSHTGRDGSTSQMRIAAAGYQGVRTGENLARGFSNPISVMNGWMMSAAHRRNILDPEFTDLGVGVAEGKGGTYWVQNFGSSGAAPPAEPVELPPTISAITPHYARMGQAVAITGQRFGEEPGVVTFTGGYLGEILAWANGEITVTVPYGAATGMVYVQTHSGTSAGAYFYVQLPLGSGPILLQIDPGSARVGSTVRISGRNLGADLGSVTFGGIAAPISRWYTGGLYVDAIVPAGATTGPVVVTRSDGAESNAINFMVTGGAAPAPTPTPPAPSPAPRSASEPVARAPLLTSLSPSTGIAGNMVILHGSWFGQTPRSVTFNGVGASILRSDDATITVTVPTGASTGPVRVRTDAGASNALGFTVTGAVKPPPPPAPTPSRPQPLPIVRPRRSTAGSSGR